MKGQHDSGEPDGVVRVDCSPQEASKLGWLVSAIKGLDSAHAQYKEDADAALMGEGVQMDRQIDWRAVQSFCFPHLMIIMAKNQRGRDDFHEFPLYVVLPRIGKSYRLRENLLPVVPPDEQTVTVEQSLLALENAAQSLPAAKGENAMRQLKILQRLLRSAA